ncbi:MAG: hypothetical protein AAF630_04110 [Cyanobacteria bacterium P01_C01_bin.38]
MMQLPSSEGESSTELQQEVEQLSNIASDIAIDSEMQAKIQSLLAQIKTSLQQQQLSIEMQRELARLLSLISILDHRNPEQIYILDLAISILLENQEDTVKSEINSNFPKKVSNKSSRNLVFIQEARRQIAIQSREYPNPFSAIIKGTGGAYNRLLSGLSWFFIIFVICPLLGVGLTFVTLNLLGARKEVVNTRYANELNLKETQIEKTNEINNALRSRLTKINDELDFILPEKASNSSATTTENENTLLTSASRKNVVEIETDKIKAIKQNIKVELETASRKESKLVASMSDSAEAGNINTPNTENEEDKTNSDSDNSQSGLTQFTGFTDWFVKQDLFFISLAVSMGALGSAISVIVRANKFIETGKEGKSDLFFTGFFRPIVGMSFAIFAVALIESGVFSGIFRIAERENRNVYLYMAIAFVAGFSERLVEDVVLKTENTLTGFSSRSDKPEK